VSILDKVKRHGVLGTLRKAVTVGPTMARYRYHRWSTRSAPQYANPSSGELAQIERDLAALGVVVQDYSPAPSGFKAFQEAAYFPLDYHGGVDSGVWDEKLLEHWITSELLELMNYQSGDIYVDVAAATSPWAKVLRERVGTSSFAIDLCEIGNAYKDLPYYRVENATATSFQSASVRGASLHCAYEMFMGNDDVTLLSEAARILKPGGKMVIAPLYMHTHYCAYSTPEYYGKGHSDPAAKEYVKADFYGVPSSRKYDAKRLHERVLQPVERLGMTYRLLALRNKDELGKNIYCHFILEITR
jgi:hypothetical protein